MFYVNHLLYIQEASGGTINRKLIRVTNENKGQFNKNIAKK